MSSQKYLRIKEDIDDKDDDIPLWRKLCFAVGGAPYQITTNVIGFFFSIFLLEVAEIEPKYVSIILFGGKAWDAITDPTCGYLVHRSPFTKFGRMKPWILLSTPFACAAYYGLFYVPDISEEAKFGYYFAMFCLFEGLLSGLHVPYTSLTMYISSKQKERDSATSYRMVSEAIGVLLAVIVQGKLVEKYRTAGECSKPESTVSPHSIDDQKWSYTLGSIIVIGIYVLCTLIVFFGVKEKRGLVEDKNSASYFRGLKTVITYGPYIKAAMAFLFISIAIGVVQGNLALYCTHALKMGDKFSDFILVVLGTSIVSMPIWQCILIKFGKKTAYAVGISIFIPVLISHLYLPAGNEYIYYVVVAIAGLGISVSLLLPWSVLPDILDLFMLETKTRKDPIFYSFYVFFNKLAIGLGLGISQVALQFGGYETGACTQPKSVELTLRLLVACPVVFVLIALLFLWRYPIDEKKREQIREDILNMM
ncbi:sodium-dependent lysophosphatidylcholine symporter 1-B-like [Gigantopelta aegis]|uniref:sodium-dependent lysophosphatidylcholine symporter 1-B-like n=1 Tax=Gigantopelta aegis TaxID=1735272 RepID=UPI001B88C561|nr:sodium-dependent lysophosphatidylcholine symporter 1-B-like [Gigantopelta aegis]